MTESFIYTDQHSRDYVSWKTVRQQQDSLQYFLLKYS